MRYEQENDFRQAGNRKKTDLWEAILAGMRLAFKDTIPIPESLDVGKCQNKWKEVQRKYGEEKKKSSLSGAARSTWALFDFVHDLAHPRQVADTRHHHVEDGLDSEKDASTISAPQAASPTLDFSGVELDDPDQADIAVNNYANTDNDTVPPPSDRSIKAPIEASTAKRKRGSDSLAEALTTTSRESNETRLAISKMQAENRLEIARLQKEARIETAKVFANAMAEALRDK